MNEIHLTSKFHRISDLSSCYIYLNLELTVEVVYIFLYFLWVVDTVSWELPSLISPDSLDLSIYSYFRVKFHGRHDGKQILRILSIIVTNRDAPIYKAAWDDGAQLLGFTHFQVLGLFAIFEWDIKLDWVAISQNLLYFVQVKGSSIYF